MQPVQVHNTHATPYSYLVLNLHTRPDTQILHMHSSDSMHAPETPQTSAPSPANKPPLQGLGAWLIIQDFAKGIHDSLPDTEEELQKHLGNHYMYADWKPAFDAIFATEEDTTAAVTAIEQLQKDAKQPNSPVDSSTHLVPVAQPKIAQLAALETELMDSVAKLKNCKRIIGTAPTLDELLNPIQEREVGDSPY